MSGEGGGAGPRLVMADVAKSFGASRALDGVSLEVGRGEVHALLGENGAGKSTLMKVLSGALRPDRGVMTLDGVSYAPSGPRQALARGVAMIYQELTIAPHLTVEGNVMLGQERTRFGLIRRREQRRVVLDVLSRLDHPDIRPETVAGELGQGARQLIEVARALVSQARVIVFDEPTSSLTERDALKLFEVIGRLAAQGISIVYISHFLEEVRRVASRYTVLRDGRSVATGAIEGTSVAELIERMVGRALGELFPREPRSPGEPILELDRVAGRVWPREASLTLRRGEVLGVFGLVGSGRTELLRAVFGLDPVRRGEVRVAGHLDRSPSPSKRIGEGVGMVSEDRKGEGLALGRTIVDNLTYPTMARFGRFGWVGRRERWAQSARWIETLGIKARGPGDAVGVLSGGNQQKVALARLLLQDADVLLLDEPTRGIDIGSKAEIYRWIGKLASSGKGVLMVSSSLPELLGVCDRVAVMSRGVLSAARPVEEWTEHSIMEVATSG